MLHRLMLVGVLALALVGNTLAENVPAEPGSPDMMDPLGRYQLQLPDGWALRGTNSRLNGFVIGNGVDSFIAVYRDGEYTIGDVLPEIRQLCNCPVPAGAVTENLENSAYPSQVIAYSTAEETLVIGGSIFPGGMFGLVAVLRDAGSLESLKSVLRNARPGPSRSE